MSFSIFREILSNRNLAVMTFTQTFYMFTAFLWWPYRSLFILELGADKELLGLILMVETICQVIFQLPGGVLTDRLGRKKVIIVGSFFRFVAPFVYLLSTHWSHIVPGLMLNMVGMISLPATNSLIAESLPPERRSSGYAAYRTITWMPMIITSLLGGMFMDYMGVVTGVRYCLMAMVAFSLISILVRWRFLEETMDLSAMREKRESQGSQDRGSFLQGLGRMPRELWILTAVAGLSAFSMRTVWSFMVVYAVEEVGITKTQWGLIGTVVSIIGTVLTLPGGMLADRIGKKPCITVSKTLGPLQTLGFTFANGFWPLMLARSVGGVAQGFGGVVWGPMGGPVWQSLVADCTPPEERGRMMGLMGSIAGLASTPASYVGGYLYDNVSPVSPFYLSFVLDALSTVVFVTMFKENRDQGESEPDEEE